MNLTFFLSTNNTLAQTTDNIISVLMRTSSQTEVQTTEALTQAAEKLAETLLQNCVDLIRVNESLAKHINLTNTLYKELYNFGEIFLRFPDNQPAIQCIQEQLNIIANSTKLSTILPCLALIIAIWSLKSWCLRFIRWHNYNEQREINPNNILMP